MKKNFLWCVWFAVQCAWQFPQLLVGLLMMPFLGKKKLVADRHFNFCWSSPDMSGGISLGPIAFVQERSSEETIAHETDGHTVQSKILGPLYLVLVGLPSLIWAWQYNPHKQCYYDFYTEKGANFHAGLVVDDRCRTHFKD